MVLRLVASVAQSRCGWWTAWATTHVDDITYITLAIARALDDDTVRRCRTARVAPPLMWLPQLLQLHWMPIVMPCCYAWVARGRASVARAGGAGSCPRRLLSKNARTK